MIKKQLMLMSLIIGLLGVYSCDDDKKPTGSGGAAVSPLPNAVGMLWVYEVYDSLTEATDTLWISVTDSLQSESLRWRLNWASSDTGVNWYAIVSAQGDTLDFWSESRPHRILLERFVLPLSLGDEWTGVVGGDASRVTDIGKVTVEAGTFNSVALVERTWNLDFEGGGDLSQTWVAPKVGVVSRYLYGTRSDGSNISVTMNQTWELLRYDLSTFSMGSFPNSVGTEWVYQVVDSSIGFVDTVTVTIASEMYLSWADTGTLWRYVGGASTDTLYVGAIDEKLYFSYSADVLEFQARYYEFPLAVGRHWGAEYFAPIPMVLDKGAVTTLAGEFPSAFHYQVSGTGFNDHWTVEDWLAPGVGVVMRKYTRFGFGPVLVQDWNLISYRSVGEIY